MTPDSTGVGWAVAGALLVTSGLGLCLRARAIVSGGLLAGAGILFIVDGLAPADPSATRAGVAAMAVLTSATATYPRPRLDLASGLTLSAVLVGTPLLARQLARVDGLEGATSCGSPSP